MGYIFPPIKEVASMKNIDACAATIVQRCSLTFRWDLYQPNVSVVND